MVFLTNPLWLIKTRMQLQPMQQPQLEPGKARQQEAYRGLWHAVRTIVKEEGPLGLYKGVCVLGGGGDRWMVACVEGEGRRNWTMDGD